MTDRATISEAIGDRPSAGRVARDVVERLDLAPGGLREALAEAVREAAYNAVDWGGGGEVVLNRAGPGVQITVHDSGPGIYATMRAAFPSLTEEQTVIHATGAGVSATGDQFRGFGLWSVLNASTYGVRVVLETGGVTLLFRNGVALPCSKSTSRSAGVTLRFRLPGSEMVAAAVRAAYTRPSFLGGCQ